MADGISMWFASDGHGVIFDLDGPKKGKNVHGIDLFTISYSTKEQRFIPGNRIHEIEGDLQKCFTYGGCEGWILEFENMDYLQATKGKCPNGTVLSVSNPSCN